MRERSPRTPRDITAAELSGQFIEIFARFVLTPAQRELQGRPVARSFGNFARQNLDHLLDTTAGTIPARALSHAVVNIFSRSAICDHAGAFQLREMTGDARLTHVQDLLQLGP